MIQLTAQMRILVAVEPQDFRKGIDGLSRICREVLGVRSTVGNGVRVPKPSGHGDSRAEL